MRDYNGEQDYLDDKCYDCKHRQEIKCVSCVNGKIKKISEQRNLFNRELRRIIVDQRFKIRELKEKLKKKN